MRIAKLPIALIFIVCLISPVLHAQAKKPLVLVDLNIRYNNPNDGVNAWPLRSSTTLPWIQEQKADIYFFQEVFLDQLKDLQAALVDYNYYGVGRDDGQSLGEYAPIFFNAQRFQFISGKTIWLSATPEIPSKSWDAACERICTWVKLYDVHTHDTLLMANTHWDHIGTQARAESGKIIAAELEKENNQFPILLGGDFNTNIQDLALTPLRTMVCPAGDTSFWSNPSFHGFGTSFSNGCIDFIFFNSKWKCVQFESVRYADSDTKNQKIYLSDHDAFIFKFEPRIFE